MTVTLGAPPPTPQASLVLALPVQARACKRDSCCCLSRAVRVQAQVTGPASGPAVCTLCTPLTAAERCCH